MLLQTIRIPSRSIQFSRYFLAPGLTSRRSCRLFANLVELIEHRSFPTSLSRLYTVIKHTQKMIKRVPTLLWPIIFKPAKKI